MRFPTADEKIERDESTRMIRHAIDSGINYFDTAWPYHKGESEELVGEVLSTSNDSGRLRDQVLLATKMPMWEVKEPSDLDRIFTEQLRKLKTDRIDFYLLHALGAESWKKIGEMDVLAWGERLKADGKIRYFGFSFHDEFPVFKEIVDGYDSWDFCQIQYNYMNEEEQAGTKGLAYAAERGIGIVTMEPLLGGSLVTVPDQVKAVFDSSAKEKAPVEWALDWLWDKDSVATALSGMSSMQQLTDNIGYAESAEVGMLTPDERALFEKAQETYEKLQPVPCTQCQYCMPCSFGVDIPGNFTIYNDLYKFGNKGAATWQYNSGMDEEKRASACTECLECLEKCPQSIQIPDWLKKIDAELAKSE